MRAFFRSCYERLRGSFGRRAPDQPAAELADAVQADVVQAEFGKAFALHQQGNLAEAEAIYRDLLLRHPDHPDALHFLGALQAQCQNLAEAEKLIGRAVEIAPDNALAHSNRGNVLKALGRNEDALLSYERVLALDPQNIDALFNRCVLLVALKRHTDAVAGYDRVLAIKPDFVEALNNRGALLADLGRHEEALASYDQALAIKPDFPGFLNNRAGLFRLMGLHERAAQDYARLLELEPGFDQALGHKLYADILGCDWKHYAADTQRLMAQVRDGKQILPFSALVLLDSAAEQLQCARTYAARKYPAISPLWTGERYRHDRIRIAYLSADFYLHATSHLMAELFERHDKTRFEVSAWSFGPDVRDAMRTRLQNAFEHFHDVRGNSDQDVAALLRSREVDMVIDLKGYSKGCRPAIFARRPAPIQVNYLVYPGTTGAACMDYIIGDAEVIPEGQEGFYSEQVVRLPDSYQVNDSKRVISERVPGRVEAGLPESGFVFCCFNNNYKITPDVFDVWMRLLKSAEGSVLWLLEDNAAASRNLRLEAEARGVRADRLVFAPRLLPPDHLARHRLADLFLDTLPCNAHTTASDALWAGLPLLTCRGHAFPGRVAASLLRAVGLPELITETLGDYETLAFKLATTPALLADIRSRLAQNRTTHPLFDIDHYRRHIESAYITMYERYQRGEAPQGFAVRHLPWSKDFL